MGRSQLSNYQSSVRPRSHLKNGTKMPPVGSLSNFQNTLKSHCQSQAALSDSTAPVVYPQNYNEDPNLSSLNQDADVSSKNLLYQVNNKPMNQDVEDLEDLDLEKQRSQRNIQLNSQATSRQIKSQQSLRKVSDECTPGRQCHSQSSKEESKDDDSSRIMMMREAKMASDNINSRESLIRDERQKDMQKSKELYMNLAIIATLLCGLILSCGFVVYSFYNMTKLGLENALAIFGLALLMDLMAIRPFSILVLSIFTTIKEFKNPSDITLIKSQKAQRDQLIDEEQLRLLGEIYEDYDTPIYISQGSQLIPHHNITEDSKYFKSETLNQGLVVNQKGSICSRDPSQKLNDLNPLEHPDYHTNFDREGSPDHMHPSPHQQSPQAPFSLKPTPIDQQEALAPSNFTATPSRPKNKHKKINQQDKNGQKLYFDLSSQQIASLNQKLQEKLLKAQENYHKNAKSGSKKFSSRSNEIMIADSTYFYHQEQPLSKNIVQQMPFSLIKDQVQNMQAVNKLKLQSPSKQNQQKHSPIKKQPQNKERNGQEVGVSETVVFNAEEEELRLRRAHLEKLRAENQNYDIEEIQMASALKKSKQEYLNPYVDQDQSDRKSLMLPQILQPQHQFETPKNPNHGRTLFNNGNQMLLQNGVNSSQQIITFNEMRDSKNDSQFFLKDFIQGLSHSSKKRKALMVGGKDYNSLQKYLDEDKENLSHSQYNSSSKHSNLQGIESGGKNPLLNSVGAKTNSKGKIGLGLRASLCGSQKRSKKYAEDPLQNIFSPPNFDGRMDPQTIQAYNSNLEMQDELIKFTPQYCSLNKSVKAQGLKHVTNKFQGKGTQLVRQSQALPENFSDFRPDPYNDLEDKVSLTKSQARPSINAGLRQSINGKTLLSVKKSLHSPTSIKENLEERMNRINHNSIISANRKSLLISQAPDYSPFAGRQQQNDPIMEACEETYLEAPTMNMPSPSREFNLMQSIDFNNPFPNSSGKKAQPLQDLTYELNQTEKMRTHINDNHHDHHLPPIFKVNNEVDQSFSFLAYNALAGGSFNDKFPPKFRESTTSNLRQYLQPQYVQQKKLEREKFRASDKSQILSYKGNSTEGDGSHHLGTQMQNLNNLNKQNTNEFNLMTDGSGPITLQDLRRQDSQKTETIQTILTEETIDQRMDHDQEEAIKVSSQLKQSRGPNSKGQVIRTEEDNDDQTLKHSGKQKKNQKKDIRSSKLKNQALKTENNQKDSQNGDFEQFFEEQDCIGVNQDRKDIDLLKTLEEHQDRENDSIHKQNLNDISRNIYNRSEGGNGVGIYDDQVSRKSKVYEDSDTSTFKIVKLGGAKGPRKQSKTSLNMRNADYTSNYGVDDMVSNQSMTHMLPPLPLPTSTKAKDMISKNKRVEIIEEQAQGPINFYSSQTNEDQNESEKRSQILQVINQKQDNEAENQSPVVNGETPQQPDDMIPQQELEMAREQQEQICENLGGEFQIIKRQEMNRDESKSSIDLTTNMQNPQQAVRGNIIQLSSQESLEGESDEEQARSNFFGRDFNQTGESNTALPFGRKQLRNRKHQFTSREQSSSSHNRSKVQNRAARQKDITDSQYEGRGFSREKNDMLTSRIADFNQQIHDDIGGRQRDQDQARRQQKEDDEILQLRIQDQMRKLKNFLKLAQQLKSSKDEKKIRELLNYLKTEQKPLPYARINELKALEMMSSPYNQSLIDMIKDEYERFTKGSSKESKATKLKGDKQSKSQQRKQGQILNKLNGIYGQPIGSHANNSFTQRKEGKRSESQQSDVKAKVGSALNSSNLKKLVSSRGNHLSRDSSTSTINLNDTNLNNLSATATQNMPKFKKRDQNEKRQPLHNKREKSQEISERQNAIKNFGVSQAIRIENFNSSDEDLEAQNMQQIQSKDMESKNQGFFGKQGANQSNNILEIRDSIEFNNLEDYV